MSAMEGVKTYCNLCFQMIEQSNSTVLDESLLEKLSFILMNNVSGLFLYLLNRIEKSIIL